MLDSDMIAGSASLGWRLRVLRARRELALIELAKLTGLDISYLSRLERDALPNAKPKPETVSKVLDGLDATQDEREAVYHIERPPLAPEEIEARVREIAAREEENSQPLVLRDDRWYSWYFNRAARAALALTADEYKRMIGSNMLLEFIDPALPRYSRVPSGERESAFSIRARMFRVNFAPEEFDGWYLKVVSRIYDFPWAVPLWENPPSDSDTLVIEQQDLNIANPTAGTIRVRLQMNHLLANPRFIVSTWTPVGRKAFARVAQVRELPEIMYDAPALTAAALREPPRESESDNADGRNNTEHSAHA
ncbi:MAG: helix-turn-helix domain-containing protein [Chloroflexia bacterium]